jgi:hypothetical protein
MGLKAGSCTFSKVDAKTLVDDYEGLAIALVDRPRPLQDSDGVEPIELHIAKVPSLDLEAGGGLAMAVSRRRIELTRTPVSAIA